MCEKLVEHGVDVNWIGSWGLNFVQRVYKEHHKDRLNIQGHALYFVCQHGFNVRELKNGEPTFDQCRTGYIQSFYKYNITYLAIFGKKLNKSLQSKRQLKFTKAQSMMQVLYKDISHYINLDFVEINNASEEGQI